MQMSTGWIRSLGALCISAILAVACSPGPVTESEAAEMQDFTIYLVRHAEKTDAADDPELTPAGRDRAETLAGLLENEPIEAIWSTDTRRTQATAAPLARRLGLEVRSYDAADLAAFAATLQSAGETALVVGHSNTTPQLSAELGGEAGTPIEEAGEYDRLYVLTGVGTDTVETEIRRFGVRHDPATE